MTLQKDKSMDDVTKKRVNIRKILSLESVINKPYSKVTIELKENPKLDEIKKILSFYGDTEVKIIINEKNKKIYYSLQKNRKFDFKDLKALKANKNVTKISF